MQNECLEDSYHVNVIVNLLVRFPEIFTITYNLAASSYCLSYMVNGKFDRDRYIELQRKLEENLEAYHYFSKKEHHHIATRKKRFNNFTQLEVVLSGNYLISNEIALITRMVKDAFGKTLISELRTEETDAYGETTAAWDELWEYMLNRSPGNTAQKLFAFRDAGKVYVFDK